MRWARSVHAAAILALAASASLGAALPDDANFPVSFDVEGVYALKLGRLHDERGPLEATLRFDAGSFECVSELFPGVRSGTYVKARRDDRLTYDETSLASLRAMATSTLTTAYEFHHGTVVSDWVVEV